MKQPKRSKKAQKTHKRTKVTAKPVEKTNAATTSSPAATVTRSKAARSNISEGTRLYALAGRPTKAQFIKVYGAKGPAMTWEQRAEAGVDAKHFQAALKAKLGKTDSAVAGS
jgi:hypothetical protein